MVLYNLAYALIICGFAISSIAIIIAFFPIMIRYDRFEPILLLMGNMYLTIGFIGYNKTIYKTIVLIWLSTVILWYITPLLWIVHIIQFCIYIYCFFEMFIRLIVQRCLFIFKIFIIYLKRFV